MTPIIKEFYKMLGEETTLGDRLLETAFRKPNKLIKLTIRDGDSYAITTYDVE